ncbi:protein arginine N-methyltransferase 9, partial [Asbolus verrucosus]
MDQEERVPRIGEVKIKVKPDYYLQRAHQEQSNGNDVLAIENYVNYMENLGNHNEMKLSEQINLTKLVLNLGAALEAKEAEDEVMKCYVEILNHFPKNVLILNAFAVYLFSRGEYNVAKGYFQRAAAEGYLPAEKNLLHVLWSLIPRWHFRMLNDKKRNKSYQEAIHKAIQSGCKKICDIGAGCGLLSLIAGTCSKEVQVTAFEESKTLHTIALRIFNGYSLKNVSLHPHNSNEVTKIICPYDLIVTEIFDAGLFGENCLESIHHALSLFINEKKFKIIPASAKLYVTGIESHNLTKKTHYTETLKELGLENICIREADSEPYDSEYLKNEYIKYVTETKSFLNVNFYDKSQLHDLITPDSSCVDDMELTCKEDGIIHALAMWFDLNLDEEITISTNPFDSDIRCWEQAVFHLKHPIPVKKNEILKLRPKITNGQILFDVLSHQSNCQQCFETSKEVISFLNDTELVQTIVRVVNGYVNCNLRVVDFNSFPLFGFLMAKRGATVYHVYKDATDLNLYKHIMEINSLCSYKFIFINEKAVDEYMVFLEPPDVVYTDLIKTDGSWNKVEFSVEIESKLKCESLPKKVFLKAQLINSDYLDICNKVDDSKALDFKIAEHMNEFSGTEHPNLESFKHQVLSSVVTYDISDLEVMDFHRDADVSRDGIVNGILYWFNVQFTDDESITFSTLNSSHYHKTCTILDSPKCVKKGDKMIIHIIREDGHLKVY